MANDVLNKFEARDYLDPAGEPLLYRLLKPLEYDPGRAWPLLLFMHGAGERGRDNKRQVTAYFGSVISSDEAMRQWPCFVVAPQLPDGSSWAFLQRIGNRIVAAQEPARALRLAVEVLNNLTTEFTIDPARVYVTGLSMGGFGTWDALWRWPDLFAAAVPVCGGGDTSRAPVFAHKPIWAFHGESDDIVPVEASRSMINAVRLAGGDPKYTEYPGVGHDSWTPAYNEPDLFDWLFSQRRG